MAMIIVISLVTAAFMFGLCWFSFGYVVTIAGHGRLLPSLQVPVFLM